MAGADYGQGAEVLSKAAKLVQGAKADLDKTSTTLENNLNPMKSQWQGQGGQAFRTLYEEWLAKQRKIVQTLDQFEQSLMSTEKLNVSTDDSQSASLAKISGRLG